MCNRAHALLATTPVRSCRDRRAGHTGYRVSVDADDDDVAPQPPTSLQSLVSARDALHEFIGQIEDDAVAAAIHAAINALPEELIPVALRRLQYLRERVQH